MLEKKKPIKNKLSPSLKLLLSAALIALLVISVVLTMYWDSKIEPMIGMDVPDQEMASAESRAMLPYICEQDPEKCLNEPVTFRGQSEEKLTRLMVSPTEDTASPSPEVDNITKKINLLAMAEFIRGTLDNLSNLSELREACRGLEDDVGICLKLPDAPYLWSVEELASYDVYPVPKKEDEKTDDSWGGKIADFLGDYIKVEKKQETDHESPLYQIKHLLEKHEWVEAANKLSDLSTTEKQRLSELIAQIAIRNTLKVQYRLLMNQIVSMK